MFTGEVPDGQGYTPISNKHQKHECVDRIVSVMLRQDPAERPNSIEEIAEELGLRPLLQRSVSSTPIRGWGDAWDSQWFEGHTQLAKKGISAAGLSGFLEMHATIGGRASLATLKSLLDIAGKAQSQQSGWPLGVLSSGQGKPKPMDQEIVADVLGNDGNSFDHWALHENGNIFVGQNFFLEKRERSKEADAVVFIKERLDRIVEAFCYCKRAYEALGVSGDTPVHVSITHTGLEDRRLLFDNDQPHQLTRVDPKIAGCDFSLKLTKFQLCELDARLEELVQPVVHALLEKFDFFEIGDGDFNALLAESRRRHWS